MPPPTTPSRADDGIERIKQNLAAKWDLHFAARDASWSPSKRDPTSLADKVHGVIQYLYYRKGPASGALEYAIKLFEAQAPLLVSEWRFKPCAELDVTPTRRESSGLNRDFLSKREKLSSVALEQLMECLYHHLTQVADRVKAGHGYVMPEVPFSSIENVEKKGHKTESGRIDRSRFPKRRVAYRQSTLSQVFRSKSDPTNHHASSDDFMDDEFSDVLQDVSMPDAVPLVSEPEESPSWQSSRHTSAADEIFVTPPTTPPSLVALPLDQQKNYVTPDGEASHTWTPSDSTSIRKRAFPEPEKMIHPRKLSRETYSSHSASETGVVGHKELYRLSKPVTSNTPNTLSSFGSSITAASSNITSPNTSFSSLSVNSRSMSFEKLSEDTDSTIRAARVQASLQGCERIDWKRKTARECPTHVERQLALSHSAVSTHEVAIQRFREGISERLTSHSPFAKIPDTAVVPFRQTYEVSRIATFCRLPLERFQVCFKKQMDNYDDLWLDMAKVTKSLGLAMPERSSTIAWERAATDFNGVSLSGKLRYRDAQSGPLFDLLLHPMQIEPSYRLARKFGGDRFCVLGIPGLGPADLPGYMKSHAAVAREIIISWLVCTEHAFLGRRWRAFYTKPESKKIDAKLRNHLGDTRYRVYLFAEDGAGFQQGVQGGEIAPRVPVRPKQCVKQLLEWFMSPEVNQTQPCLKFFARLALGLSSTVPTIEFRPEEIIRSDDARSDSPMERRLSTDRSLEKKRGGNVSASVAPIMNDGCARISRPAALAIADMLDMDEVPSVFQGRIAGAKGIWMVDCLDETPAHLAETQSRHFWIEITDAQLKFNSHPLDGLFPDPARITFEVNNCSKKLSPSFLNFQLIPILLDRGVPEAVFIKLLTEDLDTKVGEMEVSMTNGLALRKWNQDNNSVAKERAQYGGIELQGGLPVSRAERINWLVEHGFEPKHCLYLKEQLQKAIHDHSIRLENRMNIRVGQSTNAIIIADPLAVLAEDEIHLGFSNSFRDAKSGFNQTMLHNIDVIVARFPAHLPSDVQRVRAVFKPELRAYRDTIIFPSKGQVSLASKLSGGDYDGDTVWVCWDQSIVEPFKNAQVPPTPPLEKYGIQTDKTKVSDMLSHDDYIDRFLLHAFEFNLQINLLGTCTNYHEALCYARTSIGSPQAIEIAMLLGLLVDSAKCGFHFDDAKWTAFLKKSGLPRKLPLPAYKDKSNAKPTQHPIDVLVFDVAKRVRHKAVGAFAKQFADVPWWDEELVRIRKEEHEEAKSNKALAQVLRNLHLGLDKIHAFWRQHARREDYDDDFRPATERKSDGSSSLTFKALVEQCRTDFLALAPIVPTQSITSMEHDYSTIRRWQSDHRRGKSTHWDLLKASMAFHLYAPSQFVWYLAGVELGEIKATAKGRGTYRPVVNNLFDSFKVDGKFVDRARRRELEREQQAKIGFMLSEEGEEEEGCDEFGDWGWEDDI
ncbi:MAG: hypothetical protein Q9163_003032 [Psora crenata]